MRRENEGFIEWYYRMVDEILEKHGTPPVEIPAGYENPRGMPIAWIQHHLSKGRAQLALDVMRSFDEKFKLARDNSRLKLMLWIEGGALTGCWALVLMLLKMWLEHR